MRTDPLDQWLLQVRARTEDVPEFLKRSESAAHNGLQTLSDALDNPPPKGMNTYDAMRFAYPPFRIAHREVPQAETLYHRIYATGGNGTTYAQETVLDLIAREAEPSSIPFWVGLLDLTRPRDTFTTTRKTIAVAALAYLAIYHDSRETYAALRRLLAHPKAGVRALALHYLNRVHESLKRPLAANVLSEVAQIALQDTDFTPRFQARALLRDSGRPVPVDNPDGAYAFRVKFRRAKSLLQRTIELRSRQTLDELAHTTNRCLGWDMDHLYSLYMNGEKYDARYRFC